MSSNQQATKSQRVSARDAEVLRRTGIGFVFRARMRGKLVAEGWFDVKKTREVDYRVLNALEIGRPLELSTGLYNEKYRGAGVHNGRTYNAIARNYRPDHLAVLPDERGACSLEDGCGVLVNRRYDRVSPRRKKQTPLGIPTMNFADDSDGSASNQTGYSYVGNMEPLPLPTMNFAAEPDADDSEPGCGCPSNNRAESPLPLPRMKF